MQFIRYILDSRIVVALSLVLIEIFLCVLPSLSLSGIEQFGILLLLAHNQPIWAIICISVVNIYCLDGLCEW
jgi:hypothetical protein